MATHKTKMAEKIVVYDINLSQDLRILVSENPDIKYADASLKDKIFSIPNDELVRVGKVISSIKIVSVDVVSVDFLKKIFK